MHRHRLLLTIAACLLAAACADPSRTPVQPDLSVTSSVSAIQSRMDALFGGGDLRAAGASQLSTLQQTIAQGDVAAARQQMTALVTYTLRGYLNGRLQDPNGASPPTTLEAVCGLTAALYGLVQLPGPVCVAEGRNDHHNAMGVVGHEGGLVALSPPQAGVQFPAGAIDDPVLVTVRFLPPDTLRHPHGLLNTLHPQYQPFFEYADFPHQPGFRSAVVVGICVFDPPFPGAPTPEVAARLLMGHNRGLTGFEMLPPATAFFLQCGGEASAQSPGGLGGLAGSFSPFGAVDPGVGHGEGENAIR
jgi:hypothetical protein